MTLTESKKTKALPAFNPVVLFQVVLATKQLDVVCRAG
jgi:hypothetical protein